MTSTRMVTAKRIADAIREKERSVSWVAARVDMTDSTLRRKLRGIGEFTVGQVGSIGAVLDIDPNSLLPDSFHAQPTP